eukprot:5794474-Heterocapsa_arctica.AAC.1
MAGGSGYEMSPCRVPWLPSMSATRFSASPGSGSDASSGAAISQGAGSPPGGAQCSSQTEQC